MAWQADDGSGSARRWRAGDRVFAITNFWAKGYGAKNFSAGTLKPSRRGDSPEIRNGRPLHRVPMAI